MDALHTSAKPAGCDPRAYWLMPRPKAAAKSSSEPLEPYELVVPPIFSDTVVNVLAAFVPTA
jgi:hypothetical protein